MRILSNALSASSSCARSSAILRWSSSHPIAKREMMSYCSSALASANLARCSACLNVVSYNRCAPHVMHTNGCTKWHLQVGQMFTLAFDRYERKHKLWPNPRTISRPKGLDIAQGKSRCYTSSWSITISYSPPSCKHSQPVADLLSPFQLRVRGAGCRFRRASCKARC